MTPPAAYAIAVGAAIVAGWLVPALVMRGLTPALEASRLTSANYRGHTVFLGLGIVWVAWSVSLLVLSTAFDMVASLGGIEFGSVEMTLMEGPLTMPLYAVPFILTVSAVLFGMIDDVFGSHGDKGFRGHLKAMFAGRITTGGLKLLGIGAVSAVYAWHASSRAAEQAGVTGAGVIAGWWVVATLVIALSANLLNLVDLRPGRALKTYSVLGIGAGVLFVLDAAERYRVHAEQIGALWGNTEVAVTIGCMLVVLLGPVAAVWRLDLGERGMLGDAGSNAMGAIVGYLLAGSLALPWLVATAVVLLGLNLLSERVSFSRLIDTIPPLRYLDGLGRRKVEAIQADTGPGAT